MSDRQLRSLNMLYVIASLFPKSNFANFCIMAVLVGAMCFGFAEALASGRSESFLAQYGLRTFK